MCQIIEGIKFVEANKRPGVKPLIKIDKKVDVEKALLDLSS